MRFWIICIALSWGNLEAFGQSKKLLDSLQSGFRHARTDTTKIAIVSQSAGELRNAKPDTAILLAQEGLRLAEKNNYTKYNGNLYVHLGTAQRLKGDYAQALESSDKALAYFEIRKDKKGIADAYNLAGIVHENQSNHPKAIQYQLKALRIAEEIQDKAGQMPVLTNIGIIFRKQGDYDQALNYYERAYKLAQELKAERDMGLILGNIGNIYSVQKQYEKAIEYYERNKVIREKLKDKRGLGFALINMGSTYINMNQVDKGLDLCLQALKIREELGEKRGIAVAHNTIANAFYKKQAYTQAQEYAEKGLQMAKALKVGEEIQEALDMLYHIHKDKQEYAKSLDYFEAYKSLTDSLTSIERSKAIANLESRAMLEKKEQQLSLVQKDNELNKLSAERSKLESDRVARELEITEKRAEADRLFALAKQEKDKRKADSLFALANKKQLEADKLSAENKAHIAETQKQKEAVAFQRIILYLVGAGLLSLGVFAFFIYRSRQAQKRLNVALFEKTNELQTANEELHQSQEEIIAQRDFIEEQNKNLAYHNTQVKHSITTALAIQKALLPFDNRVGSFLKEYFVLYQPKDIVSGDFYWIEKVNETEIIVIAADCTGHGVPGAFMSLVAINLLDKVVLQQGETSPPQILRDLHNLVRLALKQDEIANQSGMDLAVVKISEGKILHFSGAKRPLYFIDSSRPNEVQVCGGSRKSVGGIQNESKDFEEVMMLLPTGSTFYLSSDGLADQNDVKRKRLKEEPILQTLLDNYPISMEAQKQAVQILLDTHMQGTEQRDDILLLGIKL